MRSSKNAIEHPDFLVLNITASGAVWKWQDQDTNQHVNELIVWKSVLEEL